MSTAWSSISGTTELPPPIDINDAPPNSRHSCNAIAGLKIPPGAGAATPTTSQEAPAPRARSAAADVSTALANSAAANKAQAIGLCRHVQAGSIRHR